MCLDTYDLSNRSFVLGDTMCEDNNHWSTIMIGIIWVILHLMLTVGISTMFLRFVAKYVRSSPQDKLDAPSWCLSSSGSQVTCLSFVLLVNTVQVRAVRVPYQTLIEEYADKFFSDPVLCTMGEEIGKLKGRDEHAMEKDVFQDRKYRKHVKEKNDAAASAAAASAAAPTAAVSSAAEP